MKYKDKRKEEATRGKVKEIVEDEETKRLKENIYVVFVECESPGNVGFLARTMGNFGLKKLVLINPCTLKDEAYYQAMHARETVENAEIYDTVEELVEDKQIDFIVGSTGMPGGSYNLSRIPIKPEELAKSMNYNDKIAILFGREGNGLTNAEMEMCDITVSIPTDPSYPIMNISHAAAVILYEIFKNRNHFPVEGLDESTAVEKEYLIKYMEKLIDSLPIPDHKKRNGLKVFKNIINRAFITGREAHTFKGILRRLNNKIEEE
jgi:TrmH family RNA methyltransferase